MQHLGYLLTHQRLFVRHNRLIKPSRCRRTREINKELVSEHESVRDKLLVI